MNKRTPFTPWIAFAVSGMIAASMSTASASTVYYNTANAYASNIGTDSNAFRDGLALDPNTLEVNTTFAGWDTSVSPLPFGFYNKKLNWAAAITAPGDALTVSSQNAHGRYGIWADIDTAKGAWFDGVQGWEHQIDVGLIKSDVDTVVTVNISGITNPAKGLWNNFGVSIYSGMPEGEWLEHSPWNCPSCVFNIGGVQYRTAADFQDDHPLSEGGMSYITHDATVDSLNSISFNATAGTVYTLILGGNSGGTNYSPLEGYSLNIATAAPVPLPGAVWTFGSVLVGLIGVNSRKRRA